METLLPRVGPALPAHRLLALIADAATDDVAFARQIWTLASDHCLAVVFICLNDARDLEARKRRQLATLAALTRDDRISVETRLISTSNWVRAVRSLWQPGDLVVCHAEESVHVRGRARPLSQVLKATMNVPVCAISGFYRRPPDARRGFTALAAAWAVPIGIVGGFFWLQAQIGQMPQTGLQTMFLSISVLTEFGLIGLWNQLLK